MIVRLVSLFLVTFLRICVRSEGEKYFNPKFVKQDFGVTNNWELRLLGRDYTLITGLGYYKVYTRGSNWGQAWKQCDADGAHLAIFNSMREADTVTSFATTKSNSFAFLIGFHDYFVEGMFLTITGEHLRNSGYIAWASNQPDNWSGGEHCGAVRRNALLADVHCRTAIFHFICEHELENPNKDIPFLFSLL